MAKSSTGVIDYYSAMNLPYDADLAGVENAYARLSDELAALGRVDTGANEALKRLNEAYSVLSRPERRRLYDDVFLVQYKQRQAKERQRSQRRTDIAQWLIIGAVGGILVLQGAALAYIGRDDLADLLASIF